MHDAFLLRSGDVLTLLYPMAKACQPQEWNVLFLLFYLMGRGWSAYALFYPIGEMVYEGFNQRALRPTIDV